MTPAGLPHSEIPGSMRACRSPRLIAACCVLHRLSVPRHPPSTLSNLTIKCLDLIRSAVLNPFRIHSAFLYLQPIFNCQRTTGREDRRCAFNNVETRTAGARGSLSRVLLRTCDNAPAPGLISAQPVGGADRVRTDDPLLAKQVLSQLSYSPIGSAGAWIED